MIEFTRFSLANGLKVIYHEDAANPSVVLNLLYDVGSRVENPEKTGFAHLFEHLMFGGSENVPVYDEPLQRVGGQNNAFTSQDITNYYLTLPAANVETGFWLESDRMKALSFSQEVLDVQQKVVIEEFKQRYLNQPYGDFWLKVWPLAYKQHPYNWATIGKSLEHIERFTLEDVQDFFYGYYGPNNCILVVAGAITLEHTQKLVEQYFGTLPQIEVKTKELPIELAQRELRTEDVAASVPADALYLAFHMGSRTDPDYYATDLLSDILGRGKGSKLYQQLVQDQQLFSSISAFCMGSLDPGLMIVEGKVSTGVSLEEAEKAVWSVLKDTSSGNITNVELEKAKAQAIATFEFNHVELLNRAMSLAYFELIGGAEQVNEEVSHIEKVSLTQVGYLAESILIHENCSTIRYHKSTELAGADLVAEAA